MNNIIFLFRIIICRRVNLDKLEVQLLVVALVLQIRIVLRTKSIKLLKRKESIMLK